MRLFSLQKKPESTQSLKSTSNNSPVPVTADLSRWSMQKSADLAVQLAEQCLDLKPDNYHAADSRKLTKHRPRPQLEHPWKQCCFTFLASLSLPALSDSYAAALFPRYGHSLSVLGRAGGRMCLFGGVVKGVAQNDLYVLYASDLSALLVHTTGCPPCPRAGHASVAVGDVLVVWGGDTGINGDDEYSDELDDALYVCDLEDQEWMCVVAHGPSPVGRMDHTMVVVGSKIYMFGGYTDGEYLNDIWSFDLASLTRPYWEPIEIAEDSRTPPPRSGHVCVVYGEIIIIFGGKDSRYVYNDTWAFHTPTNTWLELPCTGYLPSPRTDHAAALVEDDLYFFGGRGQDGRERRELGALRLPGSGAMSRLFSHPTDPHSVPRWFMFTRMRSGPSARAGHEMAAVGERVFVLGGAGQEPQDDSSAVGHMLETGASHQIPSAAVAS